jgi:hypothetical protein
MGKKFKVKDLTTNEIYEIDEDELTGPVKIQKPSHHVTPATKSNHKHHTQSKN